VVKLGNTKKAVIHRTGSRGIFNTACGIDVYGVLKSNKTWRGVTCKRCLSVKAKQDRVKASRTKTKTKKAATPLRSVALRGMK
jgi:hypothetical protein